MANLLDDKAVSVNETEHTGDVGQAFIDGIRYAQKLLNEAFEKSSEGSEEESVLARACIDLELEARHFEKGLGK